MEGLRNTLHVIIVFYKFKVALYFSIYSMSIALNNLILYSVCQNQSVIITPLLSLCIAAGQSEQRAARVGQ